MKTRPYQGLNYLMYATMKFLESKVKKLGLPLSPVRKSSHKTHQDHILLDYGFNEAHPSTKAFESPNMFYKKVYNAWAFNQGLYSNYKAPRASTKSHNHIIKKLWLCSLEKCHGAVFLLNSCLKDQTISDLLPL